MQPTFDMLKTWKNSDGVPAVGRSCSHLFAADEVDEIRMVRLENKLQVFSSSGKLRRGSLGPGERTVGWATLSP